MTKDGKAKHCNGSLNKGTCSPRDARRRLSDDPLQRLALVALIVGSYLRMQENSDRANQPMLPVVPGDDCDALHPLLVIFYKPSMIFKGREPSARRDRAAGGHDDPVARRRRRPLSQHPRARVRTPAPTDKDRQPASPKFRKRETPETHRGASRRRQRRWPGSSAPAPPSKKRKRTSARVPSRAPVGFGGPPRQGIKVAGAPAKNSGAEDAVDIGTAIVDAGCLLSPPPSSPTLQLRNVLSQKFLVLLFRLVCGIDLRRPLFEIDLVSLPHAKVFGTDFHFRAFDVVPNAIQPAPRSQRSRRKVLRRCYSGATGGRSREAAPADR
jgi:hypothetical protein